MTSRYVKPLLALLVLLGVSLPFTATTTAAPPAGLGWEVHGTGSGSVVLDTIPPTSIISATSTGFAMPQHVGNAMYRLDLSGPGAVVPNGVGTGICVFITGSGFIEAADDSRINFATVGILCNEDDGLDGLNSTVHYNGTYRITIFGTTGRFVGVHGGGSLTATFGSPPDDSNNFFKIDGTITGI